MRVFNRIAGCFLALCALLPSLPVSSLPEAPSVSAGSAILIEAGEGTVLYEKNADEERKIASTTKIVTALVAIGNGCLTDTFPVPKAAVGIEGSSVYLTEGETLTLEALLYAMMLRSANDAATAIAYGIAGSEERFVSMMNDRALSLGLSHTRFDNPHGLDTETNRSTARDLAALTREAMKNETFRTIVSTKKYSFPQRGDLVNHNRLLFSYPGMIGVKTGYTSKSGRCLVTAASRNGVTLIAVTLSAPDDWNDHEKLLDYGFSRISRHTPLEAYGVERTLPVVGGEVGTVRAVNLTPFSFIGENGDHAFEIRIVLPRFLYAPVPWGAQVGKAVILDHGEEIGCVPLTAIEGVPAKKERKGLLPRLISWLGSLFHR